MVRPLENLLVTPKINGCLNVLFLKSFVDKDYWAWFGRSLGCLHPGIFQEFFGILSTRTQATFSCLLLFRFAKSKQVLPGTYRLSLFRGINPVFFRVETWKKIKV